MIELMKEIEEHTEHLKALLAEQGLLETEPLTEEDIEDLTFQKLQEEADDADRGEAEDYDGDNDEYNV